MGDRERPVFDLGTELRRTRAAKAGLGRPPQPRRHWFVWILVFWAVMATALAASTIRELGQARQQGEPAPAPLAAIRPRLPDPHHSPQAAEAAALASFRNFAYFETAALLQLTLIRRERERLAAEIENFRRLQAQAAAANGAATPPAPPATTWEEDRQWLGLPPLPEVLHLEPLPETEAEMAAMAAEAEARQAAEAEAPPVDPPASWPVQDDLFFQPQNSAPNRQHQLLPPDFTADQFDPDAPAE